MTTLGRSRKLVLINNMCTQVSLKELLENQELNLTSPRFWLELQIFHNTLPIRIRFQQSYCSVYIILYFLTTQPISYFSFSRLQIKPTKYAHLISLFIFNDQLFSRILLWYVWSSVFFLFNKTFKLPIINLNWMARSTISSLEWSIPYGNRIHGYQTELTKIHSDIKTDPEKWWC